MGSAFHQLCPRYSGTLTHTAPTAIRLWESFTFTFYICRHIRITDNRLSAFISYCCACERFLSIVICTRRCERCSVSTMFDPFNYKFDCVSSILQ